MNDAELFLLSMALGMDLFSVSIPIGMNRVRWSVISRAAVVFAILHIGMILTGYHVGHYLAVMMEYMENQYLSDCWALAVPNWAGIASGTVLSGLGAVMLRGHFFARQPARTVLRHPLQGAALFLLAASVSVDALAVGLSMGMMEVDLWHLSVILGVVIFTMAVVGLGLGRYMGRLAGKRAEVLGALALVILGLQVLWAAVR